jgi:endonuclease III
MSIAEKIDPIYNWAIQIGSMLRNRGTDKSTIANILSQFQSLSDPKEAALLTMMYIRRQIGRGEIDRYAGNNLIQFLNKLYNDYYNDTERLRTNILKFLVLMKWAYESEFRRVIKDFNEFIDYITKER